jgi:hypothetical protein
MVLHLTIHLNAHVVLFYLLGSMFIVLRSAPALLTRHGVPTRAMPWLRMTSSMAIRLWG